jgi:hypothetical protein
LLADDLIADAGTQRRPAQLGIGVGMLPREQLAKLRDCASSRRGIEMNFTAEHVA